MTIVRSKTNLAKWNIGWSFWKTLVFKKLVLKLVACAILKSIIWKTILFFGEALTALMTTFIG